MESQYSVYSINGYNWFNENNCKKIILNGINDTHVEI